MLIPLLLAANGSVPGVAVLNQRKAALIRTRGPKTMLCAAADVLPLARLAARGGPSNELGRDLNEFLVAGGCTRVPARTALRADWQERFAWTGELQRLRPLHGALWIVRVRLADSVLGAPAHEARLYVAAADVVVDGAR